MLIARNVQPFVCLLLAVSTAIGAFVPARACGCSLPLVAPKSERVAVFTPPPKTCCTITTKPRSCCAPASTCGTAKASCCGEEVATVPADPMGCHCVGRDCEAPKAPQIPAAPAPLAFDADEHVAASPVPPDLIAGPHAVATHAARSLRSPPPTDLVISLSRFTC